MKTIYIDLDEELSEICSRISALQSKEILLVIPKGALLLKNPVHAQVLLKKSQEEEKELLIFTNDESGKALLKKAGFKIYQGVFKKRKKHLASNLKKLPELLIKKKETPMMSLTEMSGKISENTKRNLSKPVKRFQTAEAWSFSTQALFKTLRRKTVIGFMTLSIIFFLLVLYIAIPSSTIYLSPASNVLETTVNITLADQKTQKTLFRIPERNIIPLHPISAVFGEDLKYTATGRVFTGTSATCTLKIQNERSAPWTLVEKTRFLDKNGIMMRSGAPVEVPPARYSLSKDPSGAVVQKKNPGEALVAVGADSLDIHGNIVGDQGNLPAGTKFVLPGLSSFNQGLLTAVNEFPCTGGVTSFYSTITAEDLKAAREKMIDVLYKKAKEYLFDKVAAENILREKEGSGVGLLLLLEQPQAMKHTLLEVIIPSDLAGKKGEDFPVKGSMKIEGIAFEDSLLKEKLEEGLLAKIHPDKILSRMDYEASTMTPVYSDSDFNTLNRVKLSITVRGIEEYNFDPRSEKGQELYDQILTFVPGKSLVETSAFITNLEEIQKAHIAVWPWWKKTMPERRASIEIKVD